MRRHIRNGLVLLATAVGTFIIVPVVGGFFVELTRSLRFYAKPLEFLDGVMNAIWAFVTQTWFLLLYSFIIGLTLGAWLDWLLRNRGRTAALRALDDLYAQGTAKRNTLLGQHAEFDEQREREELRAWSHEVLAKLEDAEVSIADRSRFRTLGTFVSDPIGAQGRNARQVKLEAIWNEKLDQLRNIIDFLGA